MTATHPDAGPVVPAARLHRVPMVLPVALLAGGVLVQMTFPFHGGDGLAPTVAAVVLLAAAALTHAAASRGPAAAGVLLLVAGGGGLVAEAVGVRTGFPFGDYAYSGTLGLEVASVPALVPLAWVMMAWPATVVAHRLVGSGSRARAAARVALGAFALTAWDVFLDPQMVDAGHWTWADPTPALPGVEGIPLTNFAGWLLVSLAICAGLDRVVGRTAPGEARDAVPVAAYLWTYFSSVLAHAAFFGRPSVALVGGLVMALVAIPLAVTEGRATGWPAVRAVRHR
ncbi:carotenoid biosynthesis protein [Nocardioides litoris]|uniref:carotenoid biosynthesis protein n=1 Tax=Nocardioides litoris TaxID=1926648 RepID=UPI001B879CEB|nr:carotenoid biosynthesis protein [Nocardioides litoris]